MGPESSGWHSEEAAVAVGGTVDVAGDMSEGGSDGGRDGSKSDSGPPPSFCSGDGAFRPYCAPGPRSVGLRVIVKKPMVVRLSKDIVETYQLCNSNFRYSEALNPKRFLTFPHVGASNEGHDNENSDLILSVNLVLVGPQQRYVVKEMLGQGTFGQVAKCWVAETNSYVAVKIIKNQPAYCQQALVEVSILDMLNKKFDPDDKHHIVRIHEYFLYRRHLCISFELLGSNLYEILKMNSYKGLSLTVVQEFSQQILHALIVMKEAGIIHCDLKPENILLCDSKVQSTAIKVIDFGSACKEGRTIYSYIQSRYYRSPEVLLGYPYNTAIDMWSVGCIVAELFLGLPLFPGASEFDLLKRMIEILGGQPPDNVLREAKNTGKFFKHVGSIHSLEISDAHKGCASAYHILTEEEYEARELKKPVIGKRYFKFVKLEDIISNYPYRRNLPEEEISKENLKRLALVDFLRGLVEFDPAKRWSPLQASRHPFVTGEPFTCPYNPLPETPGILVNHVTVDHNPRGGHFLAAGLSPQVSNMNRGLQQSSPHIQMGYLSHIGSYGSYGSHGSYTDNVFLGSSYGSYGDGNSMFTFYSPAGPSGLNIQAQVGGSILGASPDTRRRPQFPHGIGFGMSPAGNFGPMSLGASPSQFTPPSSQIQVPTTSPGKYGPTSPVRGSVHGSPLGKGTAAVQYNRRRSWGHHGSLGTQSQESTSQHWQGHHGDGFSYSQPEGNFQGNVGSPSNVLPASNHPSWRQQRGGNRFSSGFSSTVLQNFPPSYPPDPCFIPSHLSDASFDKYESGSAVPDPGDWDPNYSDELLLQEDSSVVGCLASEITHGMHLGRSMDSAVLMSGVGRYNHGHNPTHTNFVVGNQRSEELVQAHANVEGSPHMGYDTHANYNRPSRFGQQPVHQFNHAQSTSLHGDRFYQMGGQLTRPNYTSADSHSSANNAYGGGTAWGRRAGHSTTTILPSSHVREDCGRIA